MGIRPLRRSKPRAVRGENAYQLQRSGSHVPVTTESTGVDEGAYGDEQLRAPHSLALGVFVNPLHSDAPRIPEKARTVIGGGMKIAEDRLAAVSMSRKGNCWDKPVAESFFATLKKELVHRRSWPNRSTLREALFEYVEVFYNRRRLHSTIGYKTPAQAESDYASPRRGLTGVNGTGKLHSSWRLGRRYFLYGSPQSGTNTILPVTAAASSIWCALTASDRASRAPITGRSLFCAKRSSRRLRSSWMVRWSRIP